MCSGNVAKFTIENWLFFYKLLNLLWCYHNEFIFLLKNITSTVNWRTVYIEVYICLFYLFLLKKSLTRTKYGSRFCFYINIFKRLGWNFIRHFYYLPINGMIKWKFKHWHILKLVFDLLKDHSSFLNDIFTNSMLI